MGANGGILEIAAKYPCWLRAPVVFFFNPRVTGHIEEEFEIANLRLWVYTENGSGFYLKM